MKRSDNLSSGTKKTVSKKSQAKSSSAKPKVTSKSKKPKSASAGKKTSSKPSSKTATTKKAAPAPKPTPKRSTHHIGVVARGQYVKNLYEVTKGKEGAERVAAINAES